MVRTILDYSVEDMKFCCRVPDAYLYPFAVYFNPEELDLMDYLL